MGLGRYIHICSCSFVLGASPDGKVIDISEGDIFGLVEIKCPEQYREYDPIDAARVAPNFCLIYANGNLKINKNHSYYDQITMQMALTGTKWCDFVVYTKKGMAIDRVYFNQNDWNELIQNIYTYYFLHYLPVCCST